MGQSINVRPITVLMPVYNGEKYLRKAIESILKQTFDDFEFLIVDDGSTDESATIVNSYADSRIRLIRNETNLGLPATLNKGLALIDTPFIARMDCDDISLPERLEKQFQYMQAHPEVGILGCNHRLINPEGKPGIFSNFPAEHGLIRWRLLFGSPIAHPCTMMRRDVLRQLDGYRSLIVAQDYDLWQRAAWRTRLANLPDVLLYLRYHGTSSSRSKAEQTETNSNLICQNAMTQMLGTPPDLELVKAIRTWQFRSPDEARLAATLLNQLYRANDNDPSLTIGEKRLIRTDASLWLLRITRQFPDWQIFYLAWEIDPLVMCHYIFSRQSI
ncbi:MAG: glycosyltransferase [Chloroflexota bacterium]